MICAVWFIVKMKRSAKMGLKMALCNAQYQILPVFNPVDLLMTIATKVK